MEFVAIDVETANPDMASICQVGIAAFSDGVPAAEWKSYIDPRDWFSPLNVAVSGIGADTVEGSPTFPEIADTLCSYLDGTIVVQSHVFRPGFHSPGL